MRNIILRAVLFWIVATAFLLSGCGSSGSGNNSTVATLKAGELKLSKMNGMAKVAAAVQGQISSATTFGNMSSSTNFDLGTIKASQNYYFLLSNPGDIPVTNVVITSTNESFVVSPGIIAELSPQNKSSIMPVIKVSITHGVALNGTGFTSNLLPMGNSTCILNITGKTKDANNTEININYSVKLIVNAEVMDVQLLDSGQLVDLFTPSGYWLGYPTSRTNQYHLDTPVIKNTGNVDLIITNTNYVINYPILEKFTLKPNEQRELLFPTKETLNGKDYKAIYLKIESNNTIANYNKLRQEPDGSVYFAIQNF